MLNIPSIHVPKAADVLADLLREKILSGKIKEGQDLPNERELGEQSGLSRSSVREALRVLEGEGLIAKRVGRNGGSSVVRPTSETIERSVRMFIRGQGIRLEAVLEARSAIEPAAAQFAAMHRTEEDLQALETCHSKLEIASAAGDLSAYTLANLEWHVQVVRASHNELLMAFISAISQSVFVATELEGFNSLEVRKAVITAHRKVMDAIKAKDGEAAARRMGRHMGAYVVNVRHFDKKS